MINPFQYAVLGLVAFAAFAVGLGIGEVRVRASQKKYDKMVASYTKSYNESILALRKEIQTKLNEVRDAEQKRESEIARLRAIANRVPTVVRVPATIRIPAAPCRDSETDFTFGNGPTRGIFSEGVGEGFAELDVRRVTQLMLEADQVSADLRAVLQACR